MSWRWVYVHDETKWQVSIVCSGKKKLNHDFPSEHKWQRVTFTNVFFTLPAEHFNIVIITKCRKADSCYQLSTETVSF